MSFQNISTICLIKNIPIMIMILVTKMNLYPPNWKKHGAKNSIRFALLPAIENLPLEISENVEVHSTVQALAKKAKFHFIESYSGGCNDHNCFVCKTQST